ncbi:Outer membrane protein OmpA [Mariprofundus aestuarium]|uniref:Outer membrane protein OmpA n=1 Tax=Mariprofundus aestuarium TaxID=1921086 RepID=A0A2K8L4C4_MARES|nr:OmpA family protein [Mariprofundus aestuarium]ATX80691.1 Outer membrane protein OmpA [Mariprofundus aestuarium]
MQKIIIRGLFITAMLMLPAIASSAEANALLQEAEAVRAQELSPSAYKAAKEAYTQRWTDKANVLAQQAISNSLVMSRTFPQLIESRDRMHVSGAIDVRKDLAERAEEAFGQVVAAVEAGDMRRAKKEADNAKLLTYQAEVVAAREQLTRPIAKALSDSRKEKGNVYAPRSFASATDGMKKVERLVNSNPAARGQLYNDSRKSLEMARTSQEIGQLGSLVRTKPETAEAWFYSRDNDMAAIAKTLNVNLAGAKSHEERVTLITDAIGQLTGQVNSLKASLAELDDTRTSLGLARFKLQQKRDAEAKIAKLAKLFDPTQVELFLTTDADVIIRMKAMNFPSGSAIIPATSYDLLEVASKAIDLFGDRVVRVEGHTDSVGNDDYNQALSERRAVTVKEYLDARFAENNRTITSVGFGEERPIANNEKAEARSQNRRIDIVLVAPPIPAN